MKFGKFSILFLCFQQKRINLFAPQYIYRSYCIKKFEFSEQTVSIKTCGNIYKEWKAQNLYRKLPDHDLEFKVPFIDTQSNSKKVSSPLLLALHGAPGSWEDFSLLISHFHSRGYRVIVPSFPNFHTYKPGIFRHSDVEKAQYLKDFLKEISISHIDHLVCHSSAVLPGLILCLNNLKIKSLSLFNPITYHEMVMRQNFTLFKFLTKASENPLALKFIETCGPFVTKNVLRYPIKVEDMLDALLSATTVVNGNVLRSKEKYLQLASKKLPIFLAFSKNDPLIYVNSSYELAELLGAKVSDIVIYDKDGALVQKGAPTETLKAVVFQEGSHYVFLKHPDIIHRELESFLRSVQ